MAPPRQACIAIIVVAGLALGLAHPAQAQFHPRGQPPWSSDDSLWGGSNGAEDYHVEISGGVWNPSAAISASSEQFGILGTSIDFGRDLGLVSRRHNELRLTFKPGRRHKLRLHWLPMEYRQSAVLERRLVFQGIAYDIGIPVNSALRWDTWRLGYEFDVVVRDRGFLGLILEAKYTDIKAELDSVIASEYVRARAPIPALGAIGRFYVTRFTPITAEFTMFRLPDNLVDGYSATYLDFDIFGTINFTKMVGANVGYRSMDLSYLFDRDSGNLKLDGIYLSGVFRF